MNPVRRWALAGTALLAPTMAMFWLDYWRSGERSKLRSPLFVGGLVLEAGCAALAAPAHPGPAIVAAGSALVGSLCAGLALRRPVARLEALAEIPSAPHHSAEASAQQVMPAPQIDGRQIVLVGAIATPAICALIYLGRKGPVPLAFHHGRFAEYRWRLAEPTALTRLGAWGGYSLHQLGLWACIYAAQQQRPAYTGPMGPLNWATLGVNLLGVALRYVQYRTQYDGLAQDVPEMTSLGSVTFMLSLILILEAPRRGLAFGNRQLRLDRPFVDFFKQYHGYIFSWALVYTFWFHPLEPTAGHLAGVGYLLLYLLQSSLMFTKAHLDRRWTVSLELLVVIHAVSAAMMNGNRYTPTFLFGFLGTALISQIHGLGLAPGLRRMLYVAYLGAAVTVMARRRSLHRLPDITHVALLEYGVVGLLYACYRLLRNLRWRLKKD